ncbi:MAG: glutathione S-transferase family protein [Planctomycetes bacterium]|nr:glutathione S-transferase family protein [Planctomycetota bacterium]
MSNVVLYEIPPSPNNIKVRIALNYKKIPYERSAINPVDRADLVKLSGQPLTPVLKHGDTVMFDSSAILRYIEANFRQGPSIFSTESNEIRMIEDFEHHGRGRLLRPIAMTFGEFFAGEKNVDTLHAASKMMHEETERLEKTLAGKKYLVGEKLTIADIVSVPAVYYAMVSEKEVGDHPIKQFFHANLHLGEGRENVRAWVDRVMALDSEG